MKNRHVFEILELEDGKWAVMAKGRNSDEYDTCVAILGKDSASHLCGKLNDAVADEISVRK